MVISDNEGQNWTIDRVNKITSWGNKNDTITIDKANKIITIKSSGRINESA